jgi:hypothetical protein
MNVPDDNTLAGKVKINLNMLGALVLNGVGEELATARYSTSALEWETMFWWFEDQEMSLSPRNTT